MSAIAQLTPIFAEAYWMTEQFRPGWRQVKSGEWESFDVAGVVACGPKAPSPLLPAVRQFCTHRVDEKARVIIKEASSEAPWALHPLGNVVFVGERWLAENGLLPMDFALREGSIAGF